MTFTKERESGLYIYFDLSLFYFVYIVDKFIKSNWKPCYK